MRKVTFSIVLVLLFLGILATFVPPVYAQYGCEFDWECPGGTCQGGTCIPNTTTCPNGTCEPGETQAGCPLDCGSPPGEQTCGTILCDDGTTGTVQCSPSCDNNPRSCWDNCGPGDGGEACNTSGDCTGAVDCGFGRTDCGEWQCANNQCYSSCTGCPTDGSPSCTSTAPATPVLSSPENARTLLGISATPTWSISTWGVKCPDNSHNINAFEVDRGIASNQLGPMCYTTGIANSGLNQSVMDPACSWNNLIRGQTYYWQVRASNGYTTTNSDVWSFTVPTSGDLRIYSREIYDTAETCDQVTGSGSPSMSGQVSATVNGPSAASVTKALDSTNFFNDMTLGTYSVTATGIPATHLSTSQVYCVPSNNLLVNGGFEQKDAGGAHEPLYWGWFDANRAGYTGTVPEGSSFMEMNQNPNNIATSSFYQDVNVTAGNYTFSAYVKSPSGVPLTLRIVMWNLNAGAHFGLRTLTIPASGWNRISTSGNMPVNGPLRAQIYIDTPGRNYDFDMMTLTSGYVKTVGTSANVDLSNSTPTDVYVGVMKYQRGGIRVTVKDISSMSTSCTELVNDAPLSTTGLTTNLRSNSSISGYFFGVPINLVPPTANFTDLLVTPSEFRISLPTKL